MSLFKDKTQRITGGTGLFGNAVRQLDSPPELSGYLSLLLHPTKETRSKLSI